MQTFYGHFQRYSPEGGEGILCFISEDNVDWFTFTRSICQWGDRGQLLSTATGEKFIAVRSNGEVMSVNMDLSALVPDDLSVYGVDPDFEVAVGQFVIDGVVKTPPTSVPSSITMRQAKLMLSRTGMLATADAIIMGIGKAVDATPEQIEAGEEARIEWAYSSVLERTHPLVLQLAAALQLPQSQLDDLFIWASVL